MNEAAGLASQSQLAEVIDGMTENLMLHIQAAEARIVREIDSMGRRLVAVEAQAAQAQAFRDGFADDDGNLINGKTVIRRIVAVEKTVGTINGLLQMGKGAIALGRVQIFVAGLILVLVLKGTWETVEWSLDKAAALLK